MDGTISVPVGSAGRQSNRHTPYPRDPHEPESFCRTCGGDQ